MNFALFAVIALLVVEMGLVGGCALIYARMRSKADAERVAMTPWGIKVEAAVGTAQAAKDTVENLKLQHYETLRQMFESQALQIGQLKGEIQTLRVEIEQLTTKVLTLQRLDRHGRKKESEAAAAATPGPGPIEGSESNSLEEMIANGTAIPLRPPKAAPRPGTPRSGFGQIP